MRIRRIAHVLGEIAILWLMAAAATASFLPRGYGLNNLDRPGFVLPGVLGGVAVALIGAAGCAALWWLLARELANQLALAAVATLALALLLPGGLTAYFLPPPLALLLSAFLLSRYGEPDDPRRHRRGP